MESKKRHREEDLTEIERSKKQRVIFIDLGGGTELKLVVNDNSSLCKKWKYNQDYEVIEKKVRKYPQVYKLRSKIPPYNIYMGVVSKDLKDELKVVRRLDELQKEWETKYSLDPKKKERLQMFQHVPKLIVDGEVNETFYYVTEWGIWDLKKQNKRMFENHMKYNDLAIYSIVKQIAFGLKVIHLAGIIHGHIKPSNILFIDENFKIMNFSNSIFLGDNEPMYTSRLYAAPEMFLNQGNYTEKIDVWSLGILFLQLCIDKELEHYNPKPNHGLEFIDEYIKRIGDTKVTARYIYGYTAKALEKIKQKTEEKKRNALPNMINPILFNMVKDRVGGYGVKLLRDMLQIDPKKRISIFDVLERIETIPKQCIFSGDEISTLAQLIPYFVEVCESSNLSPEKLKQFTLTLQKNFNVLEKYFARHNYQWWKLDPTKSEWPCEIVKILLELTKKEKSQPLLLGYLAVSHNTVPENTKILLRKYFVIVRDYLKFIVADWEKINPETYEWPYEVVEKLIFTMSKTKNPPIFLSQLTLPSILLPQDIKLDILSKLDLEDQLSIRVVNRSNKEMINKINPKKKN